MDNKKKMSGYRTDDQFNEQQKNYNTGQNPLYINDQEIRNEHYPLDNEDNSNNNFSENYNTGNRQQNNDDRSAYRSENWRERYVTYNHPDHPMQNRNRDDFEQYRNRDNAYSNHYDRRNLYNDNDRNWWEKTSDTVSSWFGNEEAERRRRMDKFNASSYKGRGPKGYKRSDERILEEVSDRLTDDHYVDASDIEVSVKDSEITLNGTVENKQAKRRAEDIADSVSGVTNVQNLLRLSQTPDLVNMRAGALGFGTIANKNPQ